MVIHGRDIGIYRVETVNGREVRYMIAAAKSCEIDVSCDMTESSGPLSGSFREYVASWKGWSIKLDYLVKSSRNYLMDVGSKWRVLVTVADGEDELWSLQGDAYVRRCRLKGNVGSLAKGVFDFLGTGPLSVVEDD